MRKVIIVLSLVFCLALPSFVFAADQDILVGIPSDQGHVAMTNGSPSGYDFVVAGDPVTFSFSSPVFVKRMFVSGHSHFNPAPAGTHLNAYMYDDAGVVIGGCSLWLPKNNLNASNSCDTGDVGYPGVSKVSLVVTAGGRMGVNVVSLFAVDNPFAVPDVPQGLSAVAGDASVSLSWSGVSGYLAGYNVYKNGQLYNLTPIDGTSFVVYGLPADVDYAWQVTAVGKNGKESAKSSVVHASAWALPEYPTLVASQVAYDRVRLEWDDVAPSYEIYQDGVVITRPTTGVTFFDVTHLMQDTAYSFYIRAKDKYGRFLDSNVISVVTSAPLPGKLSFTFTGVSSEGARLEYRSDFADTYNVYLDDVLLSGDTIDTSYSFEGLDPQTVYTVKVVAKNDAGETVGHTSFTTKKPAVPTVTSAQVSPHPTDEGKRNLEYSGSKLTAVKVFLDGELIGEFDENPVELDFSELESRFADIRVEPVEPEGVGLDLKSPVRSTGIGVIDRFVGMLAGKNGLVKSAFLILAISAIPLTILVLLFFWLRRKYLGFFGSRKKDNLPFAAVNTDSTKQMLAASKGHLVDYTPNERGRYKSRYQLSEPDKLAWRSQKKFRESGLMINTPVGFMRSGGIKAYARRSNFVGRSNRVSDQISAYNRALSGLNKKK